MWWLVLSLWACGDGAAPPPVSAPVPPTADLTPAPQPDTEWTTLRDFLPPEPGMPLPLRGLVLGMPADEAAAVLGQASVSGAVPKARRLGGRRIHSTPLAKPPTVTANLVMDAAGESLETIQLNLPASEGEAALVGTWGPAEGLVFGDGTDNVYVWTSGPVRFSWKTTPGDPVGLLLIEALTP